MCDIGVCLRLLHLLAASVILLVTSLAVSPPLEFGVGPCVKRALFSESCSSSAAPILNHLCDALMTCVMLRMLCDAVCDAVFDAVMM